MTYEIFLQVLVYPVLAGVILLEIKHQRCAGRIETEIKTINEKLSKLIGG